jgi:hypothetical protein
MASRTLTVIIASCAALSACRRDAEPAAWQVGIAHYGPLQYGMDVPAAEAAIGRSLMDVTDREPDWCDYAFLPVGSDTVAVMVVGRRVVRVDVDRRGISTDRGVRVGDPASRVREAYAERVSVEPHRYIDGQYLIVTAESPGTTAIVFETSADTIINYRAGVLPEVRWVEGCS